MARRVPNLFVVGAPKCGTSAMYTALRGHPEIFMSPLKEPHYFGFDHRRINHNGMSHDRYCTLFADAADEPCVGESSTSYLHSATAAREIREYSPDARIVIMLRNPVDVMHAYHSENLFGGFEFIPDFQEALLAEADRQAGRRWPRTKGIIENLFYRDIVRYPEQIERFWNAFGRERVRVILYDDYLRDPRQVYASAFAFIGVDPAFQPVVGSVNMNRKRRSLGVQRFLRNPPAPLRSATRLLLPETVRRRIVRSLGRLNTRETPREPLDRALRARLEAEMLPMVQRLGAMLDRDLSHWCASAGRPA